MLHGQKYKSKNVTTSENVKVKRPCCWRKFEQ